MRASLLLVFGLVSAAAGQAPLQEGFGGASANAGVTSQAGQPGERMGLAGAAGAAGFSGGMESTSAAGSTGVAGSAVATVAEESVSPAEGLRPPERSSIPAVAVHLGEATVFALRSGVAGKTAERRAEEASQALKRAFEAEPQPVKTRVKRVGDLLVVSVGQTPIIELSSLDAELAGDGSLEVHAAAISTRIQEAIDSESRRAAIAKSVFSISLVVFSGLIAFYLVRRVGELAERARVWVEGRAERELSLRVRNIEVLSPAALRSSGLLGLGLLQWLGQAGIAYTWLVVALSLFETTRGYTQRLTGFVLTPLSQLTERLASALPLLVIAAIATCAVAILVRFVGLFFAAVAQGETALSWLPADLAAPTSVLLRWGIVALAIIFGAPVVTGDANGIASRAGGYLLAALSLAVTPILACVVSGAFLLYGRRIKVGDYAEIGEVKGQVSAISLLYVRLSRPDFTEVQVPHLVVLVRPLVLRRSARPALAELSVYSTGSPADARAVVAEQMAQAKLSGDLELFEYRDQVSRFRLRVPQGEARLHEWLLALALPLEARGLIVRGFCIQGKSQ